MQMKHKSFSEEELDIIERGKQGDLRNIKEMRFYLKYLNDFKEEYLAELTEKYRKQGFFYEYLIGGVGCGLGGGFFAIVSLMCGNHLLALLLAIVAICGIAVPEMNNSDKAKNEYNNEISELQSIIYENDKKMAKEREEEEKRKLEEQEKESKKDYFIVGITKDIKTIQASKYDGYKKDVVALFSLARLYLDMKEKLKTNNPTDVLSKYVSFNTILLQIEANIAKNIKLKESQDLNEEEILNSLGVTGQQDFELMSEEELLSLIPSTEPELLLENSSPMTLS